MALPTPEEVAAVVFLLPSDHEDNGWDEAKITIRWQGTVYRTIREYWVDRVNETAGYIDLTQEGLPANQLFQNALKMLALWDKKIADDEAEEEEELQTMASTTRRIRRV